MMPVWIFGIFIIIFVGVLIWERLDYRSLKENYETATYFLDLYITQFGPSITDKEKGIEYTGIVDDTDDKE